MSAVQESRYAPACEANVRSALESLSESPRRIHDVDDLLALVGSELNRTLRKTPGAWLSRERWEDARSAIVVSLIEKYDPARNSSFSRYVYDTVPLRYIDWLRHDNGDSRYGNADREESVAEPNEHRTGSTFDVESLLSLIASYDHDRLSPRARNALQFIASRAVEEDLQMSELADLMAFARRELRDDIERLRKELLAA